MACCGALFYRLRCLWRVSRRQGCARNALPLWIVSSVGTARPSLTARKSWSLYAWWTTASVKKSCCAAGRTSAGLACRARHSTKCARLFACAVAVVVLTPCSSSCVAFRRKNPSCSSCRKPGRRCLHLPVLVKRRDLKTKVPVLEPEPEPELEPELELERVPAHHACAELRRSSRNRRLAASHPCPWPWWLQRSSPRHASGGAACSRGARSPRCAVCLGTFVAVKVLTLSLLLSYVDFRAGHPWLQIHV